MRVGWTAASFEGAETRPGQWINLCRPKLIMMTGLAEAAAKQVKVGVFESERLVDMSNHDCSLEPNVTFTPDGKWIAFRPTMLGPSHVYAVDIAKTDKAPKSDSAK